ncbi:MAG: hypothetical protein IJV43_08335, partial [Oscillospiraceae bacterium]|nr:hypothetical protein [Oscillospiraceae bacterium]
MSLTAAYSAVQASFWMSYCVAVSFAAVYLQGLGYSNAALGAVLAAGNLFGALLGPALSALIDRYDRFTAARLTPVVLAAQAAPLTLLVLTPPAGAAVDYGFARGMGSLAYVLASVLLGAWVERASVRAVPVAGLALCAL